MKEAKTKESGRRGNHALDGVLGEREGVGEGGQDRCRGRRRSGGAATSVVSGSYGLPVQKGHVGGRCHTQVGGTIRASAICEKNGRGRRS